jgi:hypothetical protein
VPYSIFGTRYGRTEFSEFAGIGFRVSHKLTNGVGFAGAVLVKFSSIEALFSADGPQICCT